MAMLLLNESFTGTWESLAGEPLAEEYWKKVISAVKDKQPNFTFIAETYWQKERQLLEIGFDYCSELFLGEARGQGVYGNQARGVNLLVFLLFVNWVLELQLSAASAPGRAFHGDFAGEYERLDRRGKKPVGAQLQFCQEAKMGDIDQKEEWTKRTFIPRWAASDMTEEIVNEDEA